MGFFRFAGISILLLLTLPVFAQQALPRQYEYDAMGNRVLRKVIQLRSATGDTALVSQEKETQQQQSDFFSDNIGDFAVTVYPNPTSGTITVQFERSVTDGQYKISSLAGHILQQSIFSSSSIKVDLSSYPAGIYLLNVKMDGIAETWKIVRR
jgi:hypothetical protein